MVRPHGAPVPAAASTPFRQDASYSALLKSVPYGTQQHVFTFAAGQAQRHDRLARLFVKSVRWDGIWTAGHGGESYLRKTSAVLGISVRTPERREVSLNARFQMGSVSGQSRGRTGDLAIFSRSLYQLSYLSVAPHLRSAGVLVNAFGRHGSSLSSRHGHRTDSTAKNTSSRRTSSASSVTAPRRTCRPRRFSTACMRKFSPPRACRLPSSSSPPN